MVYRAEAILPSDLDHGSPCVHAYVEAQLEEARQDIVGQLEEAQNIALLRLAKYQLGL